MGSLVRLRFLSNFTRRIVPLSSQINQYRLISTSKKNRDTTTIATESRSECEPAFKETSKNWITYGFSEEVRGEDRLDMHVLFFFGLTVCCIFGGFVLSYRPDDLSRDWALREGFLELRRREQEGLPLIDPNFLPLDQIVLPSDEELGNTEIII